jgi:hypothetical protein
MLVWLLPEGTPTRPGLEKHPQTYPIAVGLVNPAGFRKSSKKAALGEGGGIGMG